MKTAPFLCVVACALAPPAPAQEAAPSVEELIAGLGSSEFAVQRDAARNAAGVRDPRVATRLIELLRRGGSPEVAATRMKTAKGSVHPTVRAFAAESLGRSGDPRAADVLIEVAGAGAGPFPFVREKALVGLAATADPRAFDVLRAALADPNARAGAVAGLGELGDPRAVPILEERMRAQGPASRYFAVTARALLRLDRPLAVAILLEGFGPGDEAPSSSLVQLLRSCPDVPEVRERATELAVAEDLAVRGAALQVLSGVANLQTVSFLLGRVQEDDELRAAVIDALGEIGHEFAVDPIARWGFDRDSRVRLSVATALARIAHATAVRPLSDILSRTREPMVAIRALEGLGRIGDPVALDAIARRLGDSSRADQSPTLSRVREYPFNVSVCDVAWWAASSILDGAPPRPLAELSSHGRSEPLTTAAQRAGVEERIGR